jgi:hypothetical protein
LQATIDPKSFQSQSVFRRKTPRKLNFQLTFDSPPQNDPSPGCPCR